MGNVSTMKKLDKGKLSHKERSKRTKLTTVRSFHELLYGFFFMLQSLDRIAGLGTGKATLF